mgnify:CR=1 FL=1
MPVTPLLANTPSPPLVCGYKKKRKQLTSTPAPLGQPLPLHGPWEWFDGVVFEGMVRDAIAAADRFGFALTYLSSPDHAWSWNATVINDASPRPCSAATAGEECAAAGGVAGGAGGVQTSLLGSFHWPE